MPDRNHLTLIDLMAAVAAVALSLAVFAWDPPPPPLPGLRAQIITFRIFWFIVPLVGLLWDRWRGGRGIFGGALGGLAYASFLLMWMIAGPHGPGLPQFPIAPYSLASRVAFVVISIAGGSTLGALMGLAAWLVATVMGRPVAPALPSADGRSVRRR